MGQGLCPALGKDGLEEENRQHLQKVLSRITAGEYHEEALDVSNRAVGDEGVKLGSRALRLQFELQAIDLSYDNLSSRAVGYLVDGLSSNNSVIALNLSGNTKVGDEGCKMLAQYLSMDPPLEELSLFQCGITDEGVEALVNGLMYNTHLAILRLDRNLLTDESLSMLLELVTRCENQTLGHVTLTGNPGPMDEAALSTLRTVTTEARNNFVASREARREAKWNAEQQQKAQEDAERLEREAQEAALAAEAAEAAARESEAQREEELMRQAEEEEAARKQASVSKFALQEKRKQHEEMLKQKALESAYQWRDKVTGHGTLVREWRDGFTVMQTKPGEVPGTVPSVIPEPPRRLQACWCDPHDVSAPYAKTLHYHCKYESQHRSGELDSGDGAGKYHGCRASGHTCATVGFFAKPLPDTSAAHFFASPHPAATL